MKTDVTIPMAEGDCRAFVFTPDATSKKGGDGPWPAAILYMDAPAIRPAMFEMGDRLAQAGYYVLLPDVFWRAGPYQPFDFMKAFGGDPALGAMFAKLRASTDPEKQMADTGVWLDWIAQQLQAKAGKVGVTGYCMGGAIAMRAAGTFPDQITAKVLVAGADEDRHFDQAQCERLAAAYKAAGLDAEVTIWKGAKHGWVPTDMPVHDPEHAERHWRELVALFDGVLKS